MKSFWKNKRVLITGHSGFKGSWLTLLLHKLEAKVFGLSLIPETKPNAYELLNVKQTVTNETFTDIRNQQNVEKFIKLSNPDIIFHMAAQSLVKKSYAMPKLTFETNILGTLNILEVTRKIKNECSVVIITTDKVYEDQNWCWGYRENDKLGGHDPYSSSKTCAEHISACYRDSYFSAAKTGIRICTARAGNIIGGGDWSEDRIIPDIMRAFENNKSVSIRSPHSIRPWQHLFDPLRGYLRLAERMSYGLLIESAFNFGPPGPAIYTVKDVVRYFCEEFNVHFRNKTKISKQEKETNLLKLDISRSKDLLDWEPKITLEDSLKLTADWYKAFYKGKNMESFSFKQINNYF
ncbi:CDP-glucose 4,6-dehydratase [Betaproteobacteria bacterium]|nr:CDP-glucose 4,6-dehydratase [Betaproteobacteria bacterium]